jgi:hypothetical protein
MAVSAARTSTLIWPTTHAPSLTCRLYIDVAREEAGEGYRELGVLVAELQEFRAAERKQSAVGCADRTGGAAAVRCEQPDFTEDVAGRERDSSLRNRDNALLDEVEPVGRLTAPEKRLVGLVRLNAEVGR